MPCPQQQRMLLVAFLFLFAGQLVAGAMEDSRLLLLSLLPPQDQSRPAQDADRLGDVEDGHAPGREVRHVELGAVRR